MKVHADTCEIQSLTDVHRVIAADFLFAVSVKISCIMVQRGHCLQFSKCFPGKLAHIQPQLINEVYSQGQGCAFFHELCGCTAVRVYVWKRSSSFLVWTHKPLLCLLAAHTAAEESLQASSCVVKETCSWCSEKANSIKLYKSQSNYTRANSFNWLPVVVLVHIP